MPNNEYGDAYSKPRRALRRLPNGQERPMTVKARATAARIAGIKDEPLPPGTAPGRPLGSARRYTAM